MSGGKLALAQIRLEDSGDKDNEDLVPRVMRHKKGGRHEAHADGGLRVAIAFACAYLVNKQAFQRAAPGGLSNSA